MLTYEIRKNLRIVREAGHLPTNFNCGCCYNCKKCLGTLLDGGRLVNMQMCRGWRVEMKCRHCGNRIIKYFKNKPKKRT